MRKLFFSFFILLFVALPSFSFASTTNGTIDPLSAGNYKAKLLSDGSLINFGYFPVTNPTKQVHVTASELTGYIWSENFGWVNLNCSNNSSCGSSNFKVSNNGSGVLSGYAFGENGGWINFGPFVNSATPSVTISGTTGNFSGYAWSQNYGWIQFDCGVGNACVNTDWRSSASSVACNDGIDNDSDGLIDYPADPGCTDALDVNESNPTGGGSGTTTYECNDGLDNDADNLIDAADAGCHAGNDLNNPYTPTDNQEFNIPPDSCTIHPTDCVPPPDLCTTNPDACVPPPDICTTDPSQCVPPPDICDTDPDSCTPPPGEDCTTNPDLCTPPPDLCATNPAACVPPPDICTTNPENCVPPPDVCVTDPSLCVPPPDFCTTHPADCIPPPDEYCPPDLLHTIGCIIKETYDFTLEALTSAIYEIYNTFHTSDANLLAKIIAAVGLLAGAIFSILPVIFGTPLSFSEIFLIPYRLWSLLLSAFGLKKRARPWGTVYDAVTKQPLDPVIVTLSDLEGKEIATSITDMDGRYGFLVAPGKYRLVPKKTHYSFPSLKLIGKTRDEIYLDLYFGTVFEVKEEGQVITRNIPMDPEAFDWNEFAKRDQKLMKYYSKRDRFFTKLSDVFFSFGFTISILAVITAPSVYNAVILALYVVLLILREVGLKQRSAGRLEDKNGVPISYGVVRVYTSTTKTEVATRVADRIGKYYCLIQNGEYYVTIEKKNADESYTLLHTSAPFTVKKGFINTIFKI